MFHCYLTVEWTHRSQLVHKSVFLEWLLKEWNWYFCQLELNTAGIRENKSRLFDERKGKDRNNNLKKHMESKMWGGEGPRGNSSRTEQGSGFSMSQQSTSSQQRPCVHCADIFCYRFLFQGLLLLFNNSWKAACCLHALISHSWLAPSHVTQTSLAST